MIRFRSSTEAKSIAIRPFRAPSVIFTFVSSREVSAVAKWSSRSWWALSPRVRRAAGPGRTVPWSCVTASSVARTESPSATIR